MWNLFSHLSTEFHHIFAMFVNSTNSALMTLYVYPLEFQLFFENSAYSANSAKKCGICIVLPQNLCTFISESYLQQILKIAPKICGICRGFDLNSALVMKFPSLPIWKFITNLEMWHNALETSLPNITIDLETLLFIWKHNYLTRKLTSKTVVYLETVFFFQAKSDI